MTTDALATIGAVITNPLTLGGIALGAISLIITAFVKGWVQSASTIKSLLDVQNLRIQEANRRGDDYKVAWELSEKRGEVLQGLVDSMKIVGENQVRLLDALPIPRKRATGEKV